MQGRRKHLLIISIISLLSCFGFSFAQKLSPAQKTFIASVVKKYKVPKSYIDGLFEKGKFDPKVIRQITHPYEKKPWNIYRTYFITQKRVTQGLVFWENHKKTLNKIQKKFGIPPAIIVAVLGVETNYGTHIGTFSAFNALNTLAFNYPKRQRFFKNELSQLILLARQQKMDPITTKSSYAGALGIPQFMPSTYRHYAVDFDNVGKINLLSNFDDAMASVANYFRKHGWKTGAPVGTKFDTDHAIKDAWVSNRAIAKIPMSVWEKRGMKPLLKVKPTQKAALIELSMSKGLKRNYWLTFHNFRVIMNYNPRTTYAMAVFQLSQKIQEDYERYKAH